MAGTLSPTDQIAVSRVLAAALFSTAVATINHSDILAAVQAIDNAFDTTLTNAVAAVGGSTTVINGLAAVIPAPASGLSAPQKTIMACYILLKRVGLI